MANPDIGEIRDPHTGQMAPVRRYKTGKLLFYYVSRMGIMRPNTADGQEWMRENMRLFTPAEQAKKRDAIEGDTKPPPTPPKKERKPWLKL